MKKISKVATASVLLFTLANPLGVLAENNVENISATSNNKLTQDITIQAKEVNGGIVFEVTAVKDTYNTVIHATINGQKFTYNLGNLKKGQVSKVVQPDVSVNRKDANDVNTNKKDAAISKENKSEKSLPNTSVVRELVEKTVSYNTELNGNVIEANLVYKTYELVEKKDEKPSEKETKPVDSKVETPAESTEAKATEPEVVKPAAPTPKVEQPKTEQPEAAKPATPEPKEEKPVKPAPKEDGSEGKVSETPGAAGEASGTTSEEAGKEVKPAPKEDGSEGKDSETPGATEGAKPGATTEEGASGTTSENVKSKEETLKTEKKEGRETIEKIVTIKSDAIEKVENPEEKAKLKEQLENLKMKALEEIDKVTDPEKMADVVAKNQEKIDAIEVPGEEYTKPNYSKDNLSNGRNDGTMIEGGSTAIGHGSGEAPSGTEQPAATTEPESSVQPKNESSASTGVATQPEATSASTGVATQPSPAAETTSTAATTESTPTAQPQPAATAGTSSFRKAPEVQVRTKKVVKRDLSNKTKKINIYYNLTALKDIAGALGELDGENMLTFPGNTPKEELKRAIEEKTKAQIEKLKKQGFKVVSTTNLDQIVEGGDNYDYVVEFTKETKTQSVGTTGFRKAPATQRRDKRSAETQENVDVNIYFNLKTLPGIAGALDVDKDTTIKLPKNATVEQVKAAIQDKIAKVEKRGYKVTDAYFGAKTEQGYDFVVEFKNKK